MGQRSPVPRLHLLLLLAAGANACGPAAPLPNNLFIELDVTGGAFIFNALPNGGIENPRWCPTPRGTPCEDMGAYKRGLSNDTHYVFEGDSCPSGGSWRTDVQVQCLPDTSDTLVSAQRNTTTCLASYVIQSSRVCDVCSSPPCGTVAPLPEEYLQLFTPNGTYLFHSLSNGLDPLAPLYCPQPAGTPCTSLGNYNASASTATRYVFTGGDSCTSGGSWHTIVQFSCSPGAADDTLTAAQLDSTSCQAKFVIETSRTCVTGVTCPPPSPPPPPRPPPRPCTAMQLDQPGNRDLQFSSGGLDLQITSMPLTRTGPRLRTAYATLPGESDQTELGGRDAALSTPTRQVYRNGQVCNNQTGALWGAVAIYQCTTDSSTVDDTIVAARLNRQTCVVSITVASPRACVPQCTPPPPSGKSTCGFLQIPQPAAGQAVLNVSLILDPSNNFTISYFAPASSANSVARGCGTDPTNKTYCLLIGKYNASASTPRKQVFDRGGDFCDQNKTRRYTTDITWVCFPGLRQDKLVPVYFNYHTCRLSFNVLSSRACVTGVRCPSPPPPPRKPRPRPPPPKPRPSVHQRRPPPPKRAGRRL